MDGCSWMYRVSPEGLRMMNHYNRVEGFINYALFNPKNISGDGIRCPCKRCINKKFIDLDVMKHLRKKIHGKTLMLVCT